MTRFGPRRRAGNPNAVRTLSPVEARKAWRGLCDAALVAARAPASDPTLVLTDPLRAAPKGSYPLPAGDARRAWAEDFREQCDRYRLTANPATRAMFARTLEASAGDVERLTFALGAEVAQAAMSRSGQRDD